MISIRNTIPKLVSLYESYFREKVRSIVKLKGDGSLRLLFCLRSENHSAIGVYGSSIAENMAFIEFTQHFHNYNLNVPQIYSKEKSMIYLEQDLGDMTFFNWISLMRENGVSLEKIYDFYIKVVTVLPRFQITAGKDINFSYCYQHDEFGRESMMWDLLYFKNRFLDVFYHDSINQAALENDFNNLLRFLLEEPRNYFMYRDFQSRNIMIYNNEPYFIDYQSGRRGALEYDIASLLYDAKADIPQSMRVKLLKAYLDQVNDIEKINVEQFMIHFHGFALIRIMQALGAYGFLGSIKGKRRFLDSIPYAINNAKTLLSTHAVLSDLKMIQEIFCNLANDKIIMAYQND